MVDLLTVFNIIVSRSVLSFQGFFHLKNILYLTVSLLFKISNLKWWQAYSYTCQPILFSWYYRILSLSMLSGKLCMNRTYVGVFVGQVYQWSFTWLLIMLASSLKTLVCTKVISNLLDKPSKIWTKNQEQRAAP